MDWLQQLQDATSGAETPLSFIKWCGLTSIAAVTANNVYLNRRDENGRVIYQLKPNLYVMMIANSGLGKGLPIAIAKQLVTEVNNTRVIAGRNSIEGIIKEMSTAYSNNGGPPVVDSRAFIISGEFANLMIGNPQALTILTEWYDTHYMGEWKNTLKGSPVEKLKGVNVTLFGASSPEHFAETVPEVSIRGGFIGRTLLVYEERRNRTNPLVYLNEPTDETVNSIITPELIDYLKDISKIKGRFDWTKGASDLFVPWYCRWREKNWDDKTGTAERMPDHILKVAMCMSLSRGTSLQLESVDIEDAMDSCLNLTVNTARITASGKHPLSQATRQVLDYLYRAGPPYLLSRTTILNLSYGDFDNIDLDRIEQNLVEMEMLKVGKQGGKATYRLSEKALEMYNVLTMRN